MMFQYFVFDTYFCDSNMIMSTVMFVGMSMT
jgi:hypothetical protein